MNEDATAQPNDPDPLTTVTVLAVSPCEADRVCLGHIFGHSKWRLHWSGSCCHALEVVQHRSIPVVICEENLPDGDWRDFLRENSRSWRPPLLIVASRAAEPRLWAEVLNLGGFDVLPKPFDPRTVVHSVSLAWLQWKHLAEQDGRIIRRAMGAA